MTPKVALIMGSDSDFEKLKSCVAKLKEFKIEVDVNVISAHRTPDKAAEFAKNAEKNGIEVIICAAGLGGVIAAHTTVPVIGIPIKSTLEGMDALLATVQMPPGIPVATVGIDNGTNAAILAAQMLAIKYDYLKDALKDAKVKMVEGVEKKDEKIKKAVENIVFTEYPDFHVTVSIGGVCGVHPIMEAIHQADKLMYENKRML